MKIGFHVPIAKGFDWTLKEAKRLDCDVVQIFLKNPRSWKKKVWKDDEREAFRRLYQEIPVIGHLSYLPNLARIDEDERNLNGFIHEAELCRDLGLDSLVVHPGSRMERKTGIEMIAKAVNHVLERYDIKLFLENSSGQGASIGRDVEEIVSIYEKIDCKEKVFVCIDTAHLFQSGCNIRSKKVWTSFVRSLKEGLGQDRIGFFHLNDSKTKAGSHVDRHWHIGRGEIGIKFFRSLINDKQFAHLGGVMETPKMGKLDEENMQTMRSLLSPLVSRPFT